MSRYRFPPWWPFRYIPDSLLRTFARLLSRPQYHEHLGTAHPLPSRAEPQTLRLARVATRGEGAGQLSGAALGPFPGGRGAWLGCRGAGREVERWAGFPPRGGEGRPGGHLWSPPLSPPGSFPLTEGFAKAFLGEGCWWGRVPGIGDEKGEGHDVQIPDHLARGGGCREEQRPWGSRKNPKAVSSRQHRPSSRGTRRRGCA